MRILQWSCLLLVSGFFLTGVRAAESPRTDEVEALVGRWVDLRTQSDAEQRAWDHQSSQWRQELELLEKEQTHLTQILAGLEQSGESQQEQVAGLMARRAALTSALSQVDEHLLRLQPELAALLPLVPEALLSEALKTALMVDEKTALSVPERQATTRRLQQFLGALKELEELHNGVHTVKTLITLPDGPRREMDVIFVGLARGFAVTADGHIAAAGVPTAEGWRWRPVPSMAEEIRSLIQVASKAVPPVLVAFPIGGEMGVTPGSRTGGGQ